MLATMRPAPSTSFSSHVNSHSNGTATSTSRPPSRAASVASSTNSSSHSPVKLSTSNRSKRTGTRSGLNPKKATQPQPTDSSSNTPGLISLSRPVDSPRASNKTTSKAQRKKNNNAAAATAAAEYAEAVNASTTTPDESLLSKSAPLPASTSRKQKKKAAVAAVPSTDTASSALTWQQQLLGIGASNSSNTTTATTKNNTDKALTWQQELFNASNKAKRGPHFDVFADARDAETFGSGGEDNGGASSLGRSRSDAKARPSSRRNAGNKAVKADLALDDVFASGQTQPRRNAASQNPSTPSKANRNNNLHATAIPAGSSKSNDAAYAGPEFHNSPSAASLPAPKFLSKKQQASSVKTSGLKQATSSDEGESSSSSDAEASIDVERQKRNSQRGVTAPPSTNASHSSHNASGMNKSATIENLLAQMMGGSGLSMK